MMITPFLHRVSTLQIMMSFSTSSVHRQLPNHPLYPNIDWSKVGGGYYAIVDPMDEQGILYLSEKEYKIQIRVSVSQDSQLSVLARPNDVRVERPTPDPASTNDPSKPKTPHKEELGLIRRKSNLPTKSFAPGYLSWFISRLQKWRGRELLVTPTSENLLSLLLHWGLDLNLRAGGQLEPQPALNQALVELGKSLTRILVTRGRTALIMKMKNTLFFVNRWLGGIQETNPFLLGEPVGLARSGLPRILPLYLRRAIGSKDIRLIRVVQSLLGAYKALEGPHQDVDLVSVTTPAPDLNADTLEEFRRFCKKIFWRRIVKKFAMRAGKGYLLSPKLSYGPTSPPFYPQRGGPNHSVAILGAPLDAVAWAACPRNYPLMWAEHVGDSATCTLFNQTLELAEKARTRLRDADRLSAETKGAKRGLRVKRWNFEQELDVGRLAFLPEPAGKVRTIAIVDYWTQRVMKPVHDWMMEVLSVLPTDATFDQELALRSYVTDTKHVSRHHSIDLKSATDMIPIELYEAVLSGIWPKETVMLWRALLTDRYFRVPSDGKKESPLVIPRLRGTLIEYSRGQPMGTLSSWASMSLVHHALELFAAHKAGLDPTVFTDYRVLGDDNVTGNCTVANSYKLLCEELQVPISSAKTLEGKLFTFGGQVYLGSENISPMSLKEELSVKTCSQRLEMALRAVNRGWAGEKPSTARFLRLLCRSRDYVRSTLEFGKGKLGRVAQAALISAFGIGSHISRNLFQKSGITPFLLSLENKVEVLAGDKCHLSPRNLAVIDEVETLYAIGILRKLIAMKRAELDQLGGASSRWMEWKSWIEPLPAQVHGFRVRKRARLLPLGYKEEQGLPVLIYPKPGQWLQGKGCPDEVSWCSWSEAIWPLLDEYYSPLFNEIDESFDEGYDDFEEEEESDGYESEDEEGEDSPKGEPSGPSQAVDRNLVSRLQSAITQAEELLDTLREGNEEGDPGKDALEKVVAIFDLFVKIPRVPTFLDVKSLSPDRSPKTIDARNTWVRQMQTFGAILSHIELSRDFSVLDYPADSRVDEVGEALGMSSPGLLLSFHKEKGLSPGL